MTIIKRLRFLALLGMTNDDYRKSMFVILNEVKNLDGYAIIKRLRFLAMLGMTNKLLCMFCHSEAEPRNLIKTARYRPFSGGGILKYG